MSTVDFRCYFCAKYACGVQWISRLHSHVSRLRACDRNWIRFPLRSTAADPHVCKLLQVYAPIEQQPSAFHRVLYVYACRDGACCRKQPGGKGAVAVRAFVELVPLLSMRSRLDSLNLFTFRFGAAWIVGSTPAAPAAQPILPIQYRCFDRHGGGRRGPT